MKMSKSDENVQESDKQRQIHFSAILTPHRSLSPKGFLILMGIIGGVSFIAGVVFIINGAWPIVGFLGLDVLVIYIAFKLNYRSGRVCEVVDLVDDDLVVTRVFPSGRERQWSFNPYWVRVILEKDQHESVKMSLASHGKEFLFGTFLAHEEKEEFAEVLNRALYEYRGGRRL